MESSCHNDLVWNHEHNICDWSYNVDCSRQRISAPGADKEFDDEVVTPISGSGECSDGQYEIMPEDCSRYCTYFESPASSLHWNSLHNVPSLQLLSMR